MKVNFTPSQRSPLFVPRPKAKDGEYFKTILNHKAYCSGELTTDHAASSYGQPVFVLDGKAYGPADLVHGDFFVVDEDQSIETELRAFVASAPGIKLAMHRQNKGVIWAE